MKYFLSFLALVLSYTSFSQVTITTVNSCTAYTLTATVTGITPTDIGLYSDDSYSGLLPIGFTFNFYGNPYTQMLVGENGMITFDPTLAGGYDPWPISSALLGNASAYNSICGPWCDIDGAVATQPIYSSVQGVAPNRTQAVTWCGVYMFDCTAQWTTTQIIMYESTNIVEVHIGHKTICAAWNGGNAITGVQNSTGTSATTAPGENYGTPWTATNIAWRFTPVGTTSFTVASIPYAPIPYAASTIYWYDSTTGTYITSGPTITVSPSVTTTYEAAAVGCHDTAKAYITMTAVGGGAGGGVAPHISGFTFTNPTACNLCNGTVTLHGVTPGQIDTVFYEWAGVPQPSFTTTAGADSTITLTGLCAGLYNYIYVKVANCPSNQVSPTLTNPVLTISGITFVNPTICGLCNGSITIHGLWPGDTASIAYMRGGVIQPAVTAIVSADSTVTLTGLCAGDYTNIIATIFGCTAPGPDQLLTTPPIGISSEDITNPTVCGKCDGTITIHGLDPGLPVSVAYNWNGAVQTPVTGTVAYDSTIVLPNLCAGNYTGIIATIYGCTAPGPDETLVNPLPYPASFTMSLHPGCNGDSVILTNTSTPAGYSSIWTFGDGSSSSTQINPVHVYNDVPGYTVPYDVVTLIYWENNLATCADTITATVYFHHPVVASFTPNTYTQCVGIPVTFTNTSIPAPGSGAATYAWTFGDGNISTLANPSNPYASGGVFTTTLTVTDTLGCQNSTSQSIDIISVDVHTAFHDTSVCLSLPLVLYTQTDTAGAFDSLTYAWAPTVDLNSYTIPQPSFWAIGDFTYTVTATAWSSTLPLPDQYCNATDTVTIHSYPPVAFNNVTTSPQTVAYGSSIQLNADGALYYTWTPDNGSLNNPNINNPIATPTDSTTVYWVHGMNQYGCLDSTSVIVYVDNQMTQLVPTAFTPNGDGLNDIFRLTNFTFQKLIDFRVFNRWGNQVFQTSDMTKGWDGTYQGVAQDMGVYNYVIIVGLVDGTEKVYKGDVTLIR